MVLAFVCFLSAPSVVAPAATASQMPPLVTLLHEQMSALAHDYGFALPWVMLANMLMWAAPAQVLVITALGSGAAAVEVALAVGLSGARFLPMVVALLPMMRGPKTRSYDLLLPAHFTAASMWVESFRLLPAVPPERRVVYCNGLGAGFMLCALVGCVIGYFLTASLPPLLRNV